MLNNKKTMILFIKPAMINGIEVFNYKDIFDIFNRPHNLWTRLLAESDKNLTGMVGHCDRTIIDRIIEPDKAGIDYNECSSMITHKIDELYLPSNLNDKILFGEVEFIFDELYKFIKGSSIKEGLCLRPVWDVYEWYNTEPFIKTFNLTFDIDFVKRMQDIVDDGSIKI